MKTVRRFVGLAAVGALLTGVMSALAQVQPGLPAPPPGPPPALPAETKPAAEPALPPAAPEPGSPAAVPPEMPQTLPASLPPSLPSLPKTPEMAPPAAAAQPGNPSVNEKPASPPQAPATPALPEKAGKVQQVSPARAETMHESGTLTATADNPTGRQEPCVSLEWIGPPTARVGQPVTYQLIAKNVSGTQVHRVCVRHKVPAGVTVGGSEPKATTEGDVLVWDLGSLQAGQDRRIDLQLVPESKTPVTCQATVTFTGTSSMRVLVTEPKLVVKASTPDKVLMGDNVTVTVTVSNPGDGTADRVKVKATIPEGLEHARGKVVEVDLGNLAAKESRTLQLVCATRAAGAQKCEVVACADGNLTANDAGAIDVILPRIDLAVVGPKLRYLDRAATYTLKLTNPGSAPANNVTVATQLPQGFKYHNASSGGRHDFSTRSISWFIGDVPPGQTKEVTFEAVAVNTGDHKHRAVATAARGLRTEAEVVTRVEGLSALLMELVDLDDPVEIGTDTSYEIRVTNTGSKTETNLELACTLPEKMEFRTAKCAAGCRYRVEGREVIFEQLPRLAPRADVIYRVTVRGTAAGDLRFRARIKADGLSEPVLREESTKVYGDESLPR